jgi:hypothetical protein
MPSPADADAEERETVELVKTLRAIGDLRHVITVLRQSDDGPERAREALLALGELDLDLLVRMMLTTLLDAVGEHPAGDPETGRATPGGEPRRAGA